MHPFSAQADDTPTQIKQQVTDAIKQHFAVKVPDSRSEVQLNPINRQLNLAPCSHTLNVKVPYHSGARITAKVSCRQPRWSLFVTGRVKVLKPVVMSAGPIIKGRQIRANMLQVREQDIAGLTGDYFHRQQDVSGSVARINIRADTVITPRMLTLASAVGRGDPVILEARRGSVVIRTEGTAQEEGRIGDMIDVTNNRSGTVVRGRVTAPGRVQVP
ncbi:flagellar basal body P-ring formation chaperone FlgA [Marinobacterium weihaiense]|uniref:Flagella basal body P-ring formation protein FlgA n=1 Tax=Marinobacterium weihaiense TaxID=2851016 RepID=A0ABS6MCQ1_9GAMM|nr:flagellar basal body P-ring formation chaperone FlgA [Marinobacterium weihaiense]MBV0934064.1 flagellar basal body P-ring formation protein FlgA [Marinobacterium weihaiense]